MPITRHSEQDRGGLEAQAEEFARQHAALSWIGAATLKRLGLAVATLTLGAKPELAAMLGGFLTVARPMDRFEAASWPEIAREIEAIRAEGFGVDDEAGEPVTVVVCGDAGAMELSVAEQMRQAVEGRQAVVFLVRQSAESLDEVRVAGEYDSEQLPRIVVDAGDALAMYRVAQESVAHARRGQGPALIVCVSFAEVA